MKKLKKEEIISLLQNKGNKTFKELSLVTGYHEKSLIRISKQIKEGEYSSIHGNTSKAPYNKILEEKKKVVLKLYQNKTYSSKKEFYLYLCSLGYSYSYSWIAKIVEKKKPIKKEKRKECIFSIPRKTISENKIQYQNKRYFIKSKVPIKHREQVFLFVEKETLVPLYIQYYGKKYFLLYQESVSSKKGNTKYS